MGSRILVVAPRLDVGGTEGHLCRVLPALRQAGLDVRLFVMARGGALEKSIVLAGVPVLGVDIVDSRPISSLRAACALRREIYRWRPDILHYFLAEPYLVGSLASMGIGGMMRIMSRRSMSHYQRNHPLLAGIERRLHRSVAALIGNSSAVAAQLVEECGAPMKVGIIPNGVDLPPTPDPEQRAICRSELNIPPDAFVIALVANLIPYKGHEDLLEAMALVRERMSGPWRLMLIGRDEGIGAALRQKAETLGIGAHVLWLNERFDVPALLAAADLGILPSHQEGFSNSLIEKMAHGLPVIATRVGGNCDAVIDGESGRLVPVRDPVAFGAAIAALYGDPGLRARMGAAARQRVERFFSLEVCIRRYLRLYRGIVRNGTASVAEMIDPPDGDPTIAAAPSLVEV